MIPATGAALVVVASFTVDLSGVMPNLKMYFGRDGVIGIDQDGDMMWDGLWHSKLSHDRDHVGTNNWYLAVCPVLGHSGGPIRDVCVIGVATGITASTLSSLSTVGQLDGYDINHTLKDVYAGYPHGTLHIAENEKIRLLWQDARTGLMLNPKKYDVIQAQPLYLKQAGSGLLNSVEFYRLVSSRLNPGGVFCLYANGTAEQAFVVRQTASQAFRHGESFFNGYLLILSNDPIVMDEKSLAQNLNSDDPLWNEIRAHHETRDAAAIMKLWDQPRLPWGDGRLISTDDHPCVEYPEYLAKKYRALKYEHILPSPGEVQ